MTPNSDASISTWSAARHRSACRNETLSPFDRSLSFRLAATNGRSAASRR